MKIAEKLGSEISAVNRSIGEIDSSTAQMSQKYNSIVVTATSLISSEAAGK